MIEYNSNEDSDLKLLTWNKKHINMLLSTWSNLYNWYIDSEAFTHITNCQDLFTIISSYHKKFKVVNEETVTVTECEDVKIYIKNENFLLQDVVLISECTLNLISLEQLQCNNVVYQDEDSRMTLIRDEHTIISAQCIENLFILNIMRENVIMIIQNTLKQQDQLNFLCVFTKKLQLWHHWLAYLSVVQIRQIS